MPQPRAGSGETCDEGDRSGNGDEPGKREPDHEGAARDGEVREFGDVEGLVDAGREEGDEDPAEEGDGTGQHEHGLCDLEGREAEGEETGDGGGEEAQAVEAADDDGDELPGAAFEGVAQYEQTQLQETRNHSGPSSQVDGCEDAARRSGIRGLTLSRAGDGADGVATSSG